MENNRKNVEVELQILEEIGEGYLIEAIISDGDKIEEVRKLIFAESEINALAFALSYFTRNINNADLFVKSGNKFFTELVTEKTGIGAEFNRLFSDAYALNKNYLKWDRSSTQSETGVHALNKKNEEIIEVQEQIIKELKKLTRLLVNDNDILRDYIIAITEELEEEKEEEKTEEAEKTKGAKL